MGRHGEPKYVWGDKSKEAMKKERNMKEKCANCGCEMVINDWEGWVWECFHCDHKGRLATEEQIEHQEEEYLNRGENGISA